MSVLPALSPPPTRSLKPGDRDAFTSARVMARAWAQTFDEADRADHAARFAHAALSAFAERVAPGLTVRALDLEGGGELDTAVADLARSIGHGAAGLAIIDGCHLLTSLYASLLSDRARGADGVFYTPPSLARRLLDLAEDGGVDWTTARVLDPASGGGAFLLETAQRLRAALEGSEPAFILAQIGTRLKGFELDPRAAALSQLALDILLADLSLAGNRPLGEIVAVRDTLDVVAAARYDLVIGNPPYGRVRLSPEHRTRYARSLYGHANLYGIFTDIAVRWAKPGGLIAYLTPTSVLGGQYYSALRRLLADEAPPIAVDFVHARRGVFEDVLQETLLALYRKGGDRAGFQVHYLHVDGAGDTHLTRNGVVGLPPDTAQPWLAPRAAEHVALIRAAEAMPARLEDWGYAVSTGPLVWNRFKDQLCARDDEGCYPLIWAEAVTADGRFSFRAAKKNHQPWFLARPGDDWLVVDCACVLVQRTTAKEQRRRLIAAELPQAFVDRHRGVVVENHLNMVRASAAARLSPDVVAAVLNSDVVDQLFRCISGSVAVSAYELSAIPLPDVEAMAPVARLVSGGAGQPAIEAAIRTAYGLPA